MMSLPLSLELITLLRLGIAIGVVLIWWPRVALPQDPDLEGWDQPLHNLSRSLVILMIGGYVFVALHIFMWATIAFLLLGVWFYYRPPQNRYQLTMGSRIAATILEELDRLASLPSHLWDQIRRRFSQRRQFTMPNAYTVCTMLVVVAILALATWMRMWSNLAHAGLPFSDAYEELAWLKGIQHELLFPNGIYPQGLYLTMATLSTLSAANAMVFLKFFGPVVGLGLTCSVGYTTYRLSGRATPALVATIIYGLLPILMPYVGIRQAATDSQEFANLFVLPIAYFAYQAWHTAKPGYRTTTVALLTVVALTHPIALLNAVLAAIAGTLGAWVATGVNWTVFGRFAKGVGLAALIAILPLAIPLALGQHFLGTALPYLTSTVKSAAPPLTIEEYVSGAGCLALFLIRLLRRRQTSELGVPLVAFFLLAMAIILDEAPAFGLNNQVLYDRTGELVALAEALCLGLSWCVLEESVSWFMRQPALLWSSLAVVVAIAALALFKEPPTPFKPYRMNSDAYVVAYTQMAQNFPQASWLAVSSGGYALAVDKGYQMNPLIWTARVSPQHLWPKYQSPGKKPYAIYQTNILFFVNHHFHVVPGLSGQRKALRKRIAANQALKQWIAKWTALHGPLKVYFRTPELTIYELSRTAPYPHGHLEH